MLPANIGHGISQITAFSFSQSVACKIGQGVIILHNMSWHEIEKMHDDLWSWVRFIDYDLQEQFNSDHFVLCHPSKYVLHREKQDVPLTF